jgi:hypothetical protein
MNVETHHLFTDFRAAYDSIDREGLWNIMTKSHDRVMMVDRRQGWKEYQIHNRRILQARTRS